MTSQGVKINYSGELVCPSCNVRGKSLVRDSRGTETGLVVRRRRVCKACGHKFTTFESLAPASVLPAGTLVPDNKHLHINKEQELFGLFKALSPRQRVVVREFMRGLGS